MFTTEAMKYTSTNPDSRVNFVLASTLFAIAEGKTRYNGRSRKREILLSHHTYRTDLRRRHRYIGTVLLLRFVFQAAAISTWNGFDGQTDIIENRRTGFE
jgi:hypothetical protein